MFLSSSPDSHLRGCKHLACVRFQTSASHRIKELREEKEISRCALAKAIGVDVKTICYWENGVNEPKASYIASLAIFFKVSSDYLLGLE